MQPIDPAELSAFLDGELPADRAEEVRAALAQDSALRQSFEQLTRLDATWKARASTAVFRPKVSFPQRSFFPFASLAPVGVLALFLIRMGLKTQPPLVGATVAIGLMALLIVWGLKQLIAATEADRPAGAPA